MITTQSYIYFIKLFFVSIILLNLQTNILYAQFSDSIKVVLPIRKNNITKEYYPDLSKTKSTTLFTQDYTVKKKKLNPKYYRNNIFDINETDNPFALPITGRKSNLKTRDKSKGNLKEVFTSFFSKQDNSNSKTPPWLIFALLGFLSYMSILIAIFPKEVKSFFHAFLSTSAARKAQREQAGTFKIERFSSYILFAMTMGTFCFLIPQILIKESPFNTFAALLLTIGGISILYTLKHLQLKILSLILPIEQEINIYNFIISNTNKVLGFLLTPILFLLLYVPLSVQETVLYFSFILLGVIYLYRSFLGLISAGSIILFHKFHFIVYLCAIEIAPILISLKLLSIL